MWLEVTAGPNAATIVRVDAEPFFIGRAPESQLRLADQKVSRRHTVLRFGTDGRLIVEDLGSENGTLVNGREISQATEVSDGSEIRVGDSVIRFTLDRPGSGSEGRSIRHRVVPAFFGVLGVAAVAGGVWFLASNASGPSDTTLAVSTTTTEAPTTTETTLPPSTTTTSILTLADVVEVARLSTLHIVTLDSQGRALGAGSGWVFNGELGLIATNQHVVGIGSEFRLFGDGIMGGEEREGLLVAAAPCEDLALIQVLDADGLADFELGSQAELREGDEVVAVGFPVNASLDSPLVATAGVISVVQTSIDVFDSLPHLSNVIRTDAAINPGNSGGPLLTKDVRVVGVNTAQALTTQNENYAIGIDRAAQILSELAIGDSIGWAGLDLTSEVIDNQTILVTATVAPRSPADNAGVPARPLVVLAIDGVAMDGSIQGYCDVVGEHRSGDSAEFVFFDPDIGQELTLIITF